MSQKNKKAKKKGGKENVLESVKDRELIFKEGQEEYAKITSLLGDRRLNVMMANGVESLAVIPGKMSKKKKVWLAVDDVILVSLRDFQVNKVDVIYKYNPDEVQKLIQYLELPKTFLQKSSEETVGSKEINNDVIFDTNEEVQINDFDFNDI